MLDDLLVETFINTFYGYGNYQGDYWFIGMEENGGHSEEDISNRISTWSKRGQHELEDVAEYHKAIEVNDLFEEGARLQPTWDKLIRVLLSATLPEFNIEKVLTYQKKELGRSNRNTCLLELFPLPSPSVSDWRYNQYSLLPYLAKRSTYKKYCLDFRINHIKSKIKEFHPKVVVFYGTTYRKKWHKIADVPFSIIKQGLYEYEIGTNDKTLFAIVKHPTFRYERIYDEDSTFRYKRIPDEYFHSLGKLIASRLNQS